MEKAAVLKLRIKSPLEISEIAETLLEQRIDSYEIRLKSFGKMIRVMYPSGSIKEKLEGWHKLLLLHYLEMADDFPLSGEWISFCDLKDGLIRGTKFDYTSEHELEKLLKGKKPAEVMAACKELGAEFPETEADLSAVFLLFPRYPLRLTIWYEDEEFPASGKLQVDKSADHYLTVEDAVAAGELVIARLKNIFLSQTAENVKQSEDACK